ncbi:methyltransferase domain-containing protein [Dyella silvatica]|uniref:methyltransferase domain-containing protein n=1 Tax=Dyella silvatica TaxID=2992128 RepID=UPI002252786C|nr:methyltransferase domain-containing protein [Dyella silvatica]
MSRRDKILAGLDVRSLLGVEIGALCSPIVSRGDGEVIYVDYADTDTLKKRYAEDSHVDVENIVHVDAIWGEKTLAEAIGSERKVDYVIASHVVEHVPDLISWLQELQSILNNNGQIRLVVPDKRFTFDYLRQETKLSEVVAANFMRARIPQPHAIIDFMINKVTVDNISSWDGLIDPDKLSRDFSLHDAINVATDAVTNKNYHDVHCWVFTPRSFAMLFIEMTKLGLNSLACERFSDTEHYEIEFIVSMKYVSDVNKVISSWQSMIDAVDGNLVDDEKALANSGDESERACTFESGADSSSLKIMSSRLDKLNSELDLIKHSSSWKLTAPLRAIRRFFSA